MKHYIPSTLFVISLLMCTTSWAEKPDIDALKEQQQRLQSLLNEIKQASQQRQQHHVQIKRLKHQLECNWTLIRAYETCGQLHDKDQSEHLRCLTIAKRDMATCLASHGEK